MISQMLLIFIYGACYPLITQSAKYKNTLYEFNERCLEMLLKVAFLKNLVNFSEKWSACRTDLVELQV